jgi:hypothetical protein
VLVEVPLQGKGGPPGGPASQVRGGPDSLRMLSTRAPASGARRSSRSGRRYVATRTLAWPPQRRATPNAYGNVRAETRGGARQRLRFFPALPGGVQARLESARDDPADVLWNRRSGAASPGVIHIATYLAVMMKLTKHLMTAGLVVSMGLFSVGAGAQQNPAQNEGNAIEKKGNSLEKKANADKAAADRKKKAGEQEEARGEADAKAGQKSGNNAAEHAGKRRASKGKAMQNAAEKDAKRADREGDAASQTEKSGAKVEKAGSEIDKK